MDDGIKYDRQSNFFRRIAQDDLVLSGFALLQIDLHERSFLPDGPLALDHPSLFNPTDSPLASPSLTLTVTTHVTTEVLSYRVEHHKLLLRGLFDNHLFRRLHSQSETVRAAEKCTSRHTGHRVHRCSAPSFVPTSRRIGESVDLHQNELIQISPFQTVTGEQGHGLVHRTLKINGTAFVNQFPSHQQSKLQVDLLTVGILQWNLPISGDYPWVGNSST